MNDSKPGRYVEKALVVYPEGQYPLLEAIHSFGLTHNIQLIDVKEADFLASPGYYSDQAEHVVALVTDQNVRAFIEQAETLNFSLGLVPLHKGLMLTRWFKLPQKNKEAIRLALENDPAGYFALQRGNRAGHHEPGRNPVS